MVLSRATILVSVVKSINSASRALPTILRALLYLAAMTSNNDESPLETEFLASDNRKPYPTDNRSKVTENTCFQAGIHI